MTSKDSTISVRLSKSQKEMIEDAARLCGMSVSEFVLDAAMRRAEKIVADLGGAS